jgi:uncharacterized protein
MQRAMRPPLAGNFATSSPTGFAQGSFLIRACASSMLAAGISTIHVLPSWKYSNRKTFVSLSEKEPVMAYWMFKDTSGQWRWRLVAANNRIIAVSGESYWNKQDCRSAISLVQSSAAAPVYER